MPLKKIKVQRALIRSLFNPPESNLKWVRKLLLREGYILREREELDCCLIVLEESRLCLRCRGGSLMNKESVLEGEILKDLNASYYA